MTTKHSLASPTKLPKSQRSSSRSREIIGYVLWALVLPIPFFLALMGAWIGSTLAIYHENPVWLALLGALVAFGVLPYVWELVADRKQVGGRARDAILRSSFLSIVLIVVLLLSHGKTTYAALATRGDWFLAEAKTPAAESIRRFMFTMADRFQGLDSWREEFSYAWAGTTEGVDPTGSAAKLGTLLRSVVPRELRKEAPAVVGPEAIQPPGFVIEGTDHTWPLSPEPHPLIANMPEEVKTSIESVGTYLKDMEPDEFMRAKAIHNFVAGWVKYDHQSLLDRSYAKDNRQSAVVVFTTRTGVCSGYASLTEALSRAAGLEAVVISGTIRWSSDYKLTTPEDVEAGERNLPVGEIRGHAWNAIQANGHWYLMDTTWDKADDDGKIRSDYLFIPPEAMLSDHFPKDDRWQLLTEPVTFGHWLRSSSVRPLAFAYDVFPTNHKRPVIGYQKTFRLELTNTYQTPVMVSLVKASFVSLDEVAQAGVGAPKVKEEKTQCGAVSNFNPLVFECPGLDEGYAAEIFIQRWGEPNYAYAGQVTVAAP